MANNLTPTTFDKWVAAEHNPITGVPADEHRVSLWYEIEDNSAEMEELLSLTFWQVTAIWEGLLLFEEVAKARLQAASNTGQRDLRAPGKVMESAVMAKRKISCIRRYMASKHQTKKIDSFEEAVINRALGVDDEGTTNED